MMDKHTHPEITHTGAWKHIYQYQPKAGAQSLPKELFNGTFTKNWVGESVIKQFLWEQQNADFRFWHDCYNTSPLATPANNTAKVKRYTFHHNL